MVAGSVRLADLIGWQEGTRLGGMQDQHIRARRRTAAPGEAERWSGAMRVIVLVGARSRAPVSRKLRARHSRNPDATIGSLQASHLRLRQPASRCREIEIARAVEARIERMDEVPV